jgi:hypothetical protein
MATRPPVPGEDSALSWIKLAVAVALTVVSLILMTHHVWEPWLTWWSGPVLSFGLVYGGFWCFMWLWEVITDGDW